MPCNDITSQVTLKVDYDDRLIDFEYGKMTCGRPVKAGSDFVNWCKGQAIEVLANCQFDEVNHFFPTTDSEEGLLLYLSWDALRAISRHYLGLDEATDRQRYQISSVVADEDCIKTVMMIAPVKPDLKVRSCSAKNVTRPSQCGSSPR